MRPAALVILACLALPCLALSACGSFKEELPPGRLKSLEFLHSSRLRNTITNWFLTAARRRIFNYSLNR